MTRMVRARIKRMGDIHAASGVTVRPPEDRVREPGIKYLCPKLVPGQVITVPEDHNLLRQSCIEIVRQPERDEVLRPWVFDTPQDAKMANPNKSRLGADAIQAGLALSQGAAEHQATKLIQREAALEEAGLSKERGAASLAERLEARRTDPRYQQAARDESERLQGRDPAREEELERLREENARLRAAADERRDINEPGPADEPEDDGEDYVPTTQNRVSPDEAEEITGRKRVETPADEDEQPPVRRQRKPGVKFGGR